MKRSSSLAVILLCAVAGLASCTGSKKYTIHGENQTDGADSTYVYLLGIDGNMLDSAMILDGKFVLQGVVDTADFAYVANEYAISVLALEPGEMQLVLSQDESTVTGTPSNDEISLFMSASRGLQDEAMQQMQQIASLQDTAAGDSLSQMVYMNYYNNMEHLIDSTYDANRTNLVGVYLMGLKSSAAQSYDELMAMLEDADPYVVHSKLIRQRIESFKEDEAAGTDPSGAGDEAFSTGGIIEGQPFIDFAGVNVVGGDSVRLSQYAGQGVPVLVDFWASWCAPCRQAMGELKSLQTKYGSKIKIVGVGVGDTKENHQKAVQDLGITWPQILDVNEEAADRYNIQSIPYLILLDAQGNVVAQNLRGAEIEAAIKKVLK